MIPRENRVYEVNALADVCSTWHRAETFSMYPTSTLPSMFVLGASSQRLCIRRVDL
jgi:hypothetical protein